MDASFRCRSSGGIAGYEDHQLGCVGTILHFLHLHHRFHHHQSKLFAAARRQRKQGHDGTKYSKLKRLPTAEEEYEFMTAPETKDHMMEGFSPCPTSTTETPSKGKDSKKNKKKKTKKSSAPRQMNRTLSIHHLECDDYVLREKTATAEDGKSNYEACESAGGGTKNAELSGGNTSAVEKRSPGSRATLVVTQTGKSGEFGLSADPNSEQFFNALQDLTSATRHHANDPQMHALDPVLIRSGSYPAMGNTGRTRLRRTTTMDVPIHKETESRYGNRRDALIYDTSGHDTLRWSGSSDLPETKQEGEDKKHKTALHHFKSIKDRIKDIIKEERKEGHRISMDGVLHKVPYGQKLPSVVDSDGSLIDEFGLKNSLCNDRAASAGNKPMIPPHLRRSRSLSDSLERYSYLLESINKESKEDVSERSRPSHADTAFLVMMNRSKTLGRINSLYELETNSASKDGASSLVYDTSQTRLDTNLDSQETTTSDFSASEEQLSSNAQIDSETGYSTEKESSQQGAENSAVCTIEVQMQPAIDAASDNAESLDIDDSCSGSSIEFPLINDSCPEVHHLQVASVNEAEFNYVFNMLKKSGFGDEKFLWKWYSPEQPINPSLYVDEILNSETDASASDADTDLYHLLLFDLMNEVLLEISKESAPYDSWIPCISSHVRSVPFQYKLLPKVWQRISWHLNCQQKQNIQLDPVGLNGWKNLKYDIEQIGLELDTMILDELLDEIIFGDLLEEAISKSHALHIS